MDGQFCFPPALQSYSTGQTPPTVRPSVSVSEGKVGPDCGV